MKRLIHSIKKIFLKKVKKDYGFSYKNGTSKTVLSATEHLTFSSQTEKIKEQVTSTITNLVKEYANDPHKFLKYIQDNGTQIYKIDNADKLLKFIDEEEGVIFELKGWKALYLSIITEQVFNLHTKTVFVMRNGNIDAFYMLHHFYKWYSMKSGLPGFDFKTQQNFKRYLKNVNSPHLNKLSAEEILNLQEAVARDKEATDFVLSLARDKDGAKNVKNKISKDGSAII